MRPNPRTIRALRRPGLCRRCAGVWLAAWARGTRRAGALVLVFLSCLGVSFRAPAADVTATEATLKAVYLYNFALFVEWPAKALPRPEEGLVIGVMGSPQVAAELETIVKSKAASGRKYVVRRLGTGADVTACHMLFIGREIDFAALLSKVGSSPVLTVGEHERFAHRGGMVNFVLQESTVRFQANPSAAQKAGLKISAKMLGAAWEVIGPDSTSSPPNRTQKQR